MTHYLDRIVDRVLQFVSWSQQHPGIAIYLLALALAIGYLCASVGLAFWAAREARRQEQQRQQFRRFMQANAREWQPPAKGPKGFDRNRRRIS